MQYYALFDNKMYILLTFLQTSVIIYPMKTIKDLLDFRKECPFCHKQLKLNTKTYKSQLVDDKFYITSTAYKRAIDGGGFDFDLRITINVNDNSFSVEFYDKPITTTYALYKNIRSSDIISLRKIEYFTNYVIKNIGVLHLQGCFCKSQFFFGGYLNFDIRSNNIYFDMLEECWNVGEYRISNIYDTNETIVEQIKLGIPVGRKLNQYFELSDIRYSPYDDQQSLKKELETLFLFA